MYLIQWFRKYWTFVRFLKARNAQGSFETALLSESALAKDWLHSEEDEAWRDL